MKMILHIVFENLLGKKDIETLITSQNCFKTSSLIYKCIEKYVSQEYNDEHYYLIISKLFSDSIDNLHEDSIELLTMKHQNKFDYFQSKKAIAEYLPQVKIMCSVRVGYQSETSSSDTSSDIFTTDTETKEIIKPKKKNYKEY